MDPCDFTLWRWLNDNTERPVLLKEFVTYTSREKGTLHTGPLEQHQGQCAVGQGAGAGARGKPWPQPLLGFPLEGKAGQGNKLGLASAHIVVDVMLQEQSLATWHLILV